jgi:hypothetical protein
MLTIEFAIKFKNMSVWYVTMENTRIIFSTVHLLALPWPNLISIPTEYDNLLAKFSTKYKSLMFSNYSLLCTNLITSGRCYINH